MTQKEFYTKVIESNFSDELTAYARAAITKIEERNEKAKSARINKRREENEPILAQITELIKEKDEPMTASEIAETMDRKVQKITPLLTGLVKNGTLEVTKIKVKCKGNVNAYLIAT